MPDMFIVKSSRVWDFQKKQIILKKIEKEKLMIEGINKSLNKHKSNLEKLKAEYEEIDDSLLRDYVIIT